MSLKTNPVSSGYSTGVINSNFKKIENYVNDNLLNRDGVTTGEPNQMEVDLDMNSNDILNVGKIDAKEIDLGGTSIEKLLGHSVGESTQEADRAKQEADRAKQEADRAEAANSDNNAYLLNRANHTGTQEISTVEGLSAALEAKADQTSLYAKVDKVEGKGLSSHDFTSAEKDKLGGIEAGAQVNTVTSVNGRTGAVAGLVENTDPRLTDAREWSAATVTQAESEAGTGTTRRAWTAQRVRQAIAAWWDTIGTAFGKTLLGSADAAAARDSLGLGTAATRNVGTSDGQVPEFVSNGEGLGGFGYGRVGTSVGRYADVNDVPKRTGFYLLTEGHPNSTNNKAPLAGFYDTCIVRTLRQSTNDFVDVYLPYHQYSNGMVIAPYTSGGYATQRIVSDSVNLRTSTGQSTLYSMTQKAVTDALNTKMDVGTGGWLGRASPDSYISGYPQDMSQNVSQIYRRDSVDEGVSAFASSIHFAANDTWGRLRVGHNNQRAWIQGGTDLGGSGWTAELYHTSNTTIDGNGFIKQASPIIKLYSDTRDSEFVRVSTGVYELTGCTGLRLTDGWYIETPHDRNGNKYFNVEWYQDVEPAADKGVLDEAADVTLRIHCYERVWNPSTGTWDNGEPVDIPEGRWIDLRMNEVRQPELDSTWKDV